MASLEWSAELHRIKCPTLVVYPGAETVGSTHNYDAMRERIPDVEVLSYEGLPHNICDSVPDRCAEDVLKFLESVSANTIDTSPPGLTRGSIIFDKEMDCWVVAALARQ